jgi:hypothetical protein
MPAALGAAKMRLSAFGVYQSSIWKTETNHFKAQMVALSGSSMARSIIM